MKTNNKSLKEQRYYKAFFLDKKALQLVFELEK